MLKGTDLPKVTVAINTGAEKSSHLPKLRTFCIYLSAFSELLVRSVEASETPLYNSSTSPLVQ